MCNYTVHQVKALMNDDIPLEGHTPILVKVNENNAIRIMALVLEELQKDRFWASFTGQTLRLLEKPGKDNIPAREMIIRIVRVYLTGLGAFTHNLFLPDPRRGRNLSCNSKKTGQHRCDTHADWRQRAANNSK